MGSRTVLVIVSASACLALVIIGLLFAFVPQEVPSEFRNISRPHSPDQPASTAYEVSRALRNLPENPLAGASAEVRNEVAADLVLAVPPGSTIKADPSSWLSINEQMGTIALTMRVPGEAESRAYIGVMVWEDEAWRLLSTYPADDAH